MNLFVVSVRVHYIFSENHNFDEKLLHDSPQTTATKYTVFNSVVCLKEKFVVDFYNLGFICFKFGLWRENNRAQKSLEIR